MCDQTDTKPKKISKFSSVCSQHFVASDFSQSQQRKFLKKTAFPSVNKNKLQKDNRKVVKDDDEPIEIQMEAEDPLNNDNCGLCRSLTHLTAVENFHIALIHKCLPLVMINDNFLQKLCKNCISILDTFSMFIDKVLTVQSDFCQLTKDFNSSVLPAPRIKVEPLANIEEEVKFPSIQVINFTQEPPAAKKCEILEIVDIKPFNFDQTLQNYDDEDEIQILSPKQLKVELTDPDEDGSNELEQIRNYVYISTVFLQDHNYFQPLELSDGGVKTEYDDEPNNQPRISADFCSLCSKSFKSFRRFLIHKLSVHQTSKSKLKKHRKNVFVQRKIRKICSAIIKQKKQKALKENKKPERNRKALKSSGKTFDCPICEKKFSGTKNLYQHKISHQVSSFFCNACDKKFKRAHGLKQHVKSIHEKEKNFECSVCNHRYLLKADMHKCRHRSLKRFS